MQLCTLPVDGAPGHSKSHAYIFLLLPDFFAGKIVRSFLGRGTRVLAIRLNRKSKKAFLLVLEVLLLVFLCIFYLRIPDPDSLRADRGILDLRTWNSQIEPVLSLDGEWHYYPGTVVGEIPLTGHMESRTIEVPGYWSSSLIPESDKFGTATYGLTILLPDSTPDLLALRMRNITPNYDFWLNGKRITGAGVVSSSSDLSRSGNQVVLCPVSVDSDSLDLKISISNFHNITAGINHSIELGEFQALQNQGRKHMVLDSFALGAIFIIAVYNLFLFIIDRSRMQALYLSLICLQAFFFSGLKNELILLQIFPFLEGELRSKLIFLALNNTGGFAYLYARTLYPDHISRRYSSFFLPYMAVVTLFILATPMNIHSLFILPMEILGLGVLVFLFLSIAWKTVRRHFRDIHFSLLVLFMLSFSILAGILDDATIISFQSVGMIFLLVIMSVILVQAWEYSRNMGHMTELETSHEELTRLNQELLAISQMDSLTGVANRRRFDQQILALWEAEKFMEKNIGLIMVDIDYFKNYNDYYGHQKGDYCLRKVAEGLKSGLLRQNDFIARYGGEEFAIILSDLDRDGVLRVAENLRESVEKLSILHEASPGGAVVTVSIGCAVMQPGLSSCLTELISLADKALYHSKNIGRNSVSILDPVFQEPVRAAETLNIS